MAKNIGTLVTAAIRPNDSLDLIASAFANEIKGGLHSATSSTDRDAIISERREWGMLCSVNDENKTYKLVYEHNSNVITDNLNWVEFQGSGGGSEWVDSVISILSDEPATPSDGDRYLVGTSPTYSITGDNWSIDIEAGGMIAHWNSSGLTWLYTEPLEGMAVIVDNEYNSIYRYEGTYPTGIWYKEKQNQVRYIGATSSNGRDYTAVTFPSFSEYDREMIYIVKFDSPNIGTVSLSINNLPAIIVKKTSGLSLLDVMSDEITNNYQYVTTYNGTYFELKDASSGSGLSNKYYIEPDETIIVPPHTQYLIYGDLDVDGTIDNYGKVTVINGNISASSSINLLDEDSLVEEVSFAQIDGLGLSNYLPKWKVDPYNGYLTYYLTGTSSIYDAGDFVSVSCPTFSIVNDFVLPNGASQGYILTSDSNGLTTWQKGITKYTATQSFVANFTYSVTHGLDSYAIIYNIWNEITGEPIMVSVKKTGLNTIDIMSTDDLINARVVIIS